MSGWRKGGKEGPREEGTRGEGAKGRECGGKVLNRVCRLVNITLTRSIAASGILSFSSVFFCLFFSFFGRGYSVEQSFRLCSVLVFENPVISYGRDMKFLLKLIIYLSVLFFPFLLMYFFYLYQSRGTFVGLLIKSKSFLS